MNTTFSFWLSAVWITSRVANKPCFKIYTIKELIQLYNIFVNTNDCRRRFRYLQLSSCMYLQNLNVKQVWLEKKKVWPMYIPILDAWEFIMHTWHTCIADENENRVYRANNPYDTIQTSYTLNRFRIPTNAKYWYFQCNREKRDTSRFRFETSWTEVPWTATYSPSAYKPHPSPPHHPVKTSTCKQNITSDFKPHGYM